MNDDIARTTAKYLSSKAKVGVLIAAYSEGKYDRLTIHVYDNPELERIDQVRRLHKTKGAIVCHRGEELSAHQLTFWTIAPNIGPRKGGAA